VNRDPLGLRRNLQGFADLVFELYWRDNTGVPGEYDILLCHRDRCAERHWAGKLW
jgi:hypothetical protein